MRGLVLAAGILAGASQALAAQPFDITGSWVPVAGASARLGPSPVYDNTAKQVSLVNDSSAAWGYGFDKQVGGAFAGKALGPKGKIEQVVGAFRAGGRRFVLSTETGNATGEIVGSEMEICWSDSLPNYIGASCTRYQRK